jgi:hypothetical protein
MPPTVEELQAAADKAAADLEAAQAANKPRTASQAFHDWCVQVQHLLGNHPELTRLLAEVETLESSFSAAPTAETDTTVTSPGAPIPLYPAAPHLAIEPKE